jgi:hypothetical protein
MILLLYGFTFPFIPRLPGDASGSGPENKLLQERDPRSDADDYQDDNRRENETHQLAFHFTS